MKVGQNYRPYNCIFRDARRSIPRLVHAYWCAVLTQDKINKYPTDFTIESDSVRLLAPDQSILEDAKENNGKLDGAVRSKRLRELKNPYAYERQGFTNRSIRRLWSGVTGD